MNNTILSEVKKREADKRWATRLIQYFFLHGTLPAPSPSCKSTPPHTSDLATDAEESCRPLPNWARFPASQCNLSLRRERGPG
ncbi:hypothetical protein CEXT_104281 [Caerostris extrusa]|uniref:Uncharacterized protein n=1 Tax=Caerostris extrusa TaxID=172846 RepID=A0AAV4MPV1_CAEEX|nr:hypothetical protein CEXT_104281 [Caerostris extrusa]